MSPEIAAAERAKDVRDAARGWKRADFISDAVLARIFEMYPDPRRRFGPALRALAFIFATIAAWAIIGLSVFFLSPEWDHAWVFFFGWTVVLVALTEIQRGAMKRSDAGSESATAVLAVVFMVTSVLVNEDTHSAHGLAVRVFSSILLVCSAAAWRWGERIFFLGAALSWFGLLTQFPQGRLSWIITALVLIPLSIRAARSGRLAPAMRRGATIVGAMALLALYAAIHIWSWDNLAIEWLNTTTSATTSPMPDNVRWPSIVATALLPPFLVILGWKRRERLLIYGGLLLIAVSLATIRLYQVVMPLSFALITIGALCIALALWTRGWLRSGPGGERDGFTADPLFDDENRTVVVRSAISMASFTPAAQAASAPAAFQGEGGSFGGGGASGSF
ncbi:MAG: hypothetical protein ABI672_04705 [Vicinamibacteria bacterium]